MMLVKTITAYLEAGLMPGFAEINKQNKKQQQKSVDDSNRIRNSL